MSEWIKTAKVGDKVVAVDNAPKTGFRDFENSERLVIGQVYTVKDIFITVEGRVAFELVEIRRSDSSIAHWRGTRVGYGAYRFRPVTPRKTDIAWAHDILRKVGKPVTEDA